MTDNTESTESLSDTGTDTAEVEAGEDTQFPQPPAPVSVEVTDRIYRGIREEFGEDDAASLQRVWGDNALSNERLVRSVIQEHPQLDQAYVEHQTENGSISPDGIAHALRYVLQQSGDSSALAFLQKHQELENIYTDHADENGNLSIAGAYRALAYIGKTKRGKR